MRNMRKLALSLFVIIIFLISAAKWFLPQDGIVAMDMRQKRLNHSMTLLRTGEVLVVGGDKSSTGTSAEFFDPVRKQFHGLQAIPTIGSHTAISLQDGNVLLLSEKNIVLYDLKTNKFQALKGDNFTRSFFAPSLLPNGEVFVGEVTSTEGCSSGGQACLKIATRLQLYNPVLKQFRLVNTLQPLPPKDKMLEAYIPGISGKELTILQENHVLPRINDCHSFAINPLKDKRSLFLTCGSSPIRAHDKAYLWETQSRQLTDLGKLARPAMHYSFAELDSGFLLAGGQAPTWFDSKAYLNSAQFIPKPRPK